MKKDIGEYLIVFAVFLSLSLIATYPMISDITGHIVGTHGSVDSGDAYIVSWLFWWIEFARTRLAVSPFVTGYQFYPHAIELIGEISPFYNIIGGVITHYFNFVAAYNVRVLSSFVLTGIITYMCFKRLGNSVLGAISGAIAFTFSYYHVIRATQGHIDLASTEWYGLYMLGIFSTICTGRVRLPMIIFAAVGLALTGYTDFRNFSHLMHFAFISMLTYTCVCLARGMFRLAAKYIGFVGMVVGIAGFLLAPLVYYSIIHYPLGSLVGSVDPKYIPDFRMLFIPPNTTFLSWILTGHKAPIQWVSENEVVYLGIPVLLSMSSLYMVRREKNKIFYWIIAGIAVMYTTLLFYGWDRFYALLYPLYVFRPLIVTSRLVVLLHFCLATLSAVAVTRLEHHVGRVWRRSLWLIPLLLFIDTLVIPVSTIDAYEVSEITKLKSFPTATVLELPFSFRTIHRVISGVDNNISLLHQTFHEKPIIGGYMTTLDMKVWKKFSQDSLLIKLAQCQDESVCEPLSEAEKERFLFYYNIRYLIVPSTYTNSVIGRFFQKSFEWQAVSLGSGYQVYVVSSAEIY